MSTVLSIKRHGVQPLTRAEIMDALDASPDFQRDENGCWRLRAGSNIQDLFLNVEDDHAWTDGSSQWLTDSALQRLDRLATKLGAEVVDETGETTAVNPMGSPTTWSGKLSMGVVAIISVAALPIMLLIAAIRIPWILRSLLKRSV